MPAPGLKNSELYARLKEVPAEDWGHVLFAECDYHNARLKFVDVNGRFIDTVFLRHKPSDQWHEIYLDHKGQLIISAPLKEVWTSYDGFISTNTTISEHHPDIDIYKRYSCTSLEYLLLIESSYDDFDIDHESISIEITEIPACKDRFLYTFIGDNFVNYWGQVFNKLFISSHADAASYEFSILSSITAICLQEHNPEGKICRFETSGEDIILSVFYGEKEITRFSENAPLVSPDLFPYRLYLNIADDLPYQRFPDDDADIGIRVINMPAHPVSSLKQSAHENMKRLKEYSEYAKDGWVEIRNLYNFIQARKKENLDN